MKYTATHEWLAEGDPARLGITDYAQEALGEIVFFESLVRPGDKVAKGDPLCDVESVKTSAQAYAPHEAQVVAVNEALEADPSPLNGDPQGAGWIVALSPGGGEGLMDEAAYAAFCEAEEG